jgi:para-aminobenzoate synthetase component 1
MPRFRLDSSLPKAAPWRLLPASSDMILRCDADTLVTTFSDAGEIISSWTNPLEALRWLGEFKCPPEIRWVGFISYDLGRLFEAIPARAVDDLHLPLFAFAMCFDFTGEDWQPAEMEQANPRRGEQSPAPPPQRTSTFSADGYQQAVARVIDYIRAGDIFQANLSQRFTVAGAQTPRQIYENLLRSSPASYGGLLDFGDFALICNSPELFLRVTRDSANGKRRVMTRPIKGTRPRGPGMEDELRHSSKDRAELNMIIDLERNDLGRVCEVGSVKVTEPRSIETHPTVYHGVATIEGIIRDEVDLVDLLRATFPGGSVTGAPKIRAMEIIEELEPVRRGPYCGAIGYLADGVMEFNIAIRTMIARDGKVHISVGGGIVADSDPAAEYDETLVKARAMFAALGIS